MILIAMLLGGGATLAGLALLTDRRGLTGRIVDTYLNPMFSEPTLLRVFGRLGVEHPAMDAFRRRSKGLVLLRVWGGVLALIGLVFLTVGTALLLA
ncbi:hypothetical protein HHL19_30400 [Streptomyces sp. R302]|uniref:hypothetical protein n=1 Tax=unclassified Streptomyces TaxID=2593676 RepID=UPI00145CF0E2|nr:MULTISPECIES: hypothetical protein [unclassified Streptomyces]NML53170.1 hypothetical protein [Streptomyces sp. R301]NML82853.1 hypothetical protein [Streptomyces sp. R302]